MRGGALRGAVSAIGRGRGGLFALDAEPPQRSNDVPAATGVLGARARIAVPLGLLEHVSTGLANTIARRRNGHRGGHDAIGSTCWHGI